MGIFKRGRPSKKSPPEKPGIYRWRNRETGDIDYIGETSNLKDRKWYHEYSDKPVSDETHDYEWQVADGRSTSKTRRKIEDKKIEQHGTRTRENNRRGGGGRHAKR